MTKRLLLTIGVAVALLVLAAPAMAWNGYREDYTTTDACAFCHSGIAGIPAVYAEWSDTGHANSGGRANRLPYGSSCGGCHSSNFDPSKIVPSPTATNATTGAVSWTGANAYPVLPQSDPSANAATSEAFVGCSNCHYGANVGSNQGADANDTAHNAPFGNLADAQICGQCHSRYSYSVMTHDVLPVPYLAVDAAGSPIPNPSPTTLLQPQYASGYKMLGEPTDWVPAGLATVLNVQFPGWTPTPNPAATTAVGLQAYWQVDGVDTMWQYRGHDGSANQYPDWLTEGHAESLEDLKTVMGPNPPARCLECHSADYRIAVEAGKPADEIPTGAEAKHGITCVGCHTPHVEGEAVGEWSANFRPQLRTDSQDTLCIECHNGEIPENTEASPGAEIHHPMKEMIEGYGAIDVAGFPSVHKDKCVQCHMAPTTTSPTGGNHTFTIIEPEVADKARVNPALLPTLAPTASPTPTPRMPYSSCSGANGCHTRSAGPNATFDRYGLYLQDTIEQRQAWTKARVLPPDDDPATATGTIWTALDVAAVNLGYADVDAAHAALVAIPAAQRTTAQKAFLAAFTVVRDSLRVTTHGVLTMTPVWAVSACDMAVLTIILE
jgi:nitrate/TMAO reductase-like tetraheme cytochrome c subunit